MAFRFTLATVLRVKESIERREERALREIQLEMARVSRQIDEIDANIAQSQNARNRMLQQRTPAGQLQTMLREAQGAVEKRKTLLQTLQTLEQQRNQQLLVYQAAHRDCETLINLADGQRAAYELAEARAQQKYLDDIFIARHHRS
jgi:flagellar FliJ protein